MRGLVFLVFVTLTHAAPQAYNNPNTFHQPHLQYGPAPVRAMDFLKDLKAVSAVQSVNIDENNLDLENSFSSNELEQYSAQSPAPFTPNTLAYSNGFSSPKEPGRLQFNQQQTNTYSQAQPIISKRFYIHTAPEEEEEEIQQRFLTVGKPRKNYNVVFIKSPSKAVHRSSIKISPAVNEEKTVIYVLAKKQDSTDIDAQVHEPVTTTTKPEVYFIKYKTHEEAKHAQRSIQAQYEALGGSSQVSDEGIAPVSSAIGSLDTIKYAAENDFQFVNGGAVLNENGDSAEEFINMQIYQDQQVPAEQVTNSSNDYLPPVKKYRL